MLLDVYYRILSDAPEAQPFATCLAKMIKGLLPPGEHDQSSASIQYTRPMPQQHQPGRRGQGLAFRLVQGVGFWVQGEVGLGFRV